MVWLNKLSVGTRLCLICVSFALPLLVLFWLLVAEFNERISFTAKEIEGCHQLAELEAVWQSALNALIDDNPDALGEMDEPFAGLKTGAAAGYWIDDLELAWRRCRSVGRVDSAAWTDFGGFFTTAVRMIGDKSNLILDSDLDSYYMMDAVVVSIPDAQNLVMDLHCVGRDLIDGGKNAGTLGKRMGFLRYRLLDVDKRVVDSLTKAVDNDSRYYGADLREADLKQALDKFHASCVDLAVALEALQAKPDDKESALAFTGGVRAASGSAAALWNLCAGELESLLSLRMAAIRERRAHGFWLIGVSLSLALGLAFVISKSVTAPLLELTRVSHLISLGDIGGARRFLNELDVDVRNRRSEVCLLAAGFSGMVEGLYGLIDEVKSSCVKMLSAATSVASNSSRQEMEIVRFGSGVENIGASLAEISAGGRRLTATVDRVSEAAREMADSSIDGRRMIRVMEGAVGGLSSSSLEMKESLSAISASFNRVDMILSTINEVADRTNLLSLNAAIEAERAGDAGTGFAVVAREIRVLADRAASATMEIERVIAETSGRVVSGLECMESFSVSADTCGAAIADIAAGMADIIGRIDALTPEFELIRDGVARESAGVDAIHHTVLAFEGGARGMSEATAELNHAAVALRDSAAGLNVKVGKFNL